ncbi:MAG: hypothetical protein IPK03_00600 [Bacteroidetes bacterium]|nr:hypothetical protein [Bacteroidota bacterium]
MKKILSIAILSLMISFQAKSTIVTINATAANKFSPDSVVIRWGDTIQFGNMSGHRAIEVSSTAWNANGKTAAAGGFNTVSAGNTITNLNIGVHYYVDTHFVATDTMKGRICVLQRIAPLSDCNDLFISEYIRGKRK